MKIHEITILILCKLPVGFYVFFKIQKKKEVKEIKNNAFWEQFSQKKERKAKKKRNRVGF